MNSGRRNQRDLRVPHPAPSRDGDHFDWRARGACRDLEPDLFFPDPSESAVDALTACSACVVRPQCLTWALQTRQQYGIWGGTTEDDRRHLLATPHEPRPAAASQTGAAA